MRVDALSGTAVGRYQLGGRIQMLPYASIYRGTRSPEGTPVLVWTFQEPYATAAGFLEAVQRLCGDPRAARVPGLLRVLEIGIQERPLPVIYLVNEDASSGFLVSLLQAGRAPGVFATTTRLARAVDQMHQLGMVHGDIQPATVAIGDIGPVLVAHSIRTVVSRVTPSASWIDITRGFRPPEAPMSSEPVRASDLWGLAALVYYLLVGRPPATGGAIVPPSRLRPQLPGRVDRAVMRALAPDPGQRFTTASEFLRALRGGAPTTTRHAHTPAPEPQVAPAPEPPATATAPGSVATGEVETKESGSLARTVPESEATPSARPTEPSPRWPTEPALTPASVRAQSLPQDDDRLAALSSEPT
ncbi:MAG: serine/threonine protein kinase, partial [Candidatus Dormibacteria bacterium]